MTDTDEVSRRLAERVADEQARLERVVDRLAEVAAPGGMSELRSCLTEVVRDVCGAAVALFIAQDEDEGAATVVGPEGRVFAEAPSLRRAPLLAAGFLADEVLRVDDSARWAANDGARLYGSLADGRVLRSWLAAPVLSRAGGRLGLLLAGDPRAHAFEARHERLIDALARQLAVAIENSTLLDERLRIANGLQETLLPPLLPDIDGADIAARYRPSGEESLVGGDFYDVFRSNDQRWVAAIGDVCGVGPEAAAVTGVARYTLRAVARQDADPPSALAALNDAIMSRRTESRFCTGIVLAMEARDGALRITWSSAGHPPPLLMHDDGRSELLDHRLGPLLGVIPDAVFHSDDIVLQPGDALVLYTDGVTEARTAEGEQFGEERLAQLVASCAGRTADGIARRIELAVIDHLQAAPNDDIAIMVVRSRPT